MIFEFAHHMGLLPLFWLAFLRSRGKAVGIEWWWLAGVFAVSWIADSAAHYADSWVIGAVYPVSQAAVVAAVLLPRKESIALVLVLVSVGIVSTAWREPEGPDVLLRTVAWLSVVGIIWRLPQLERLRTSLLVTFGAGWLAWMGYVIRPGWPSYLMYQGTRLLGILLFCWAATSPLPRLRITSTSTPYR